MKGAGADSGQTMEPSQPNDRYRRLAGLALGAALGLIYGVVSQCSNLVALPGVPLYLPPFGIAGNIAVSTLGAALLGVITAWPRGGVQGAFVASAVSAVVIVAGSFASAGLSGKTLTAVALTGIFLVLPFWGMLVPVIAALRWAVGNQEEAQRERLPARARVSGPLVLVVAVALLGMLSLYRSEARDLLRKTHLVLQEGQAATNVDALPRSLRDAEGISFLSRPRISYKLSWEQRQIERYRISRPGRNFDHHSVVVARFADGWSLVCLYVTADEAPLCKGFEVLPE